MKTKKNQFVFVLFRFLRIAQKSVPQYVIESSVRSETVNNLKHVDTSISKQTVVNAVISTKVADDTLQLFLVVSPVRTMFVHIISEKFVWCTTERVEIFSVSTIGADVDRDPMFSG